MVALLSNQFVSCLPLLYILLPQSTDTFADPYPVQHPLRDEPRCASSPLPTQGWLPALSCSFAWWRLVGAVDRSLPISRGRSMVRRSKAPPYKPNHHHLTTAPRQRGTTAAVAPHIHARLPAVERAWDDGWRVRCIETSALGERWMRRYSSGATAGTYAYPSTSA